MFAWGIPQVKNVLNGDERPETQESNYAWNGVTKVDFKIPGCTKASRSVPPVVAKPDEGEGRCTA